MWNTATNSFQTFLLICKNINNKTENWRNGIMFYRMTAFSCSQLFLVVNVSFKINCWGETSDRIIRVFIIYCVSKAKLLETMHRIVKVLQYMYYIFLSVCKLEKRVKSVCNWWHWTMPEVQLSLYRENNSFKRFTRTELLFFWDIFSGQT